MQTSTRTNALDAVQAAHRAYFDLVADRANWKNPIHAEVFVPVGCSATDLANAIRDAVGFFAGGRCTVEHVTGLEHEVTRLVVRAPGYYAVIGA